MVLENKRNQGREQRSTVARLKALFDWVDDKMPSLYTMSVDRVRLADKSKKVEAEVIRLGGGRHEQKAKIICQTHF